jgi:hypothetical protein
MVKKDIIQDRVVITLLEFQLHALFTVPKSEFLLIFTPFTAIYLCKRSRKMRWPLPGHPI